MKLFNREELIGLIEEINQIDHKSEAEIDALIEQLEKGALDPEITNYIYWSEMSAEEIADKVLAYKPFCL